jgi:plasmid maintenance system killer protein
MIKSFRGKETHKLFERARSKRFGSIAKVATRKLTQLDAAETLEFLRSPPGNRLEELKRMLMPTEDSAAPAAMIGKHSVDPFPSD